VTEAEHQGQRATEQYWEARLARIDIARLARDHRITDMSLLESVVFDADQYYEVIRYAELHGGSDTLNKIEKPISMLLDLLANEINHDCLFGELFTAGGVAIAKKLEELPPFLETVREAARAAHWSRRRGRPKCKSDLRVAYRSLVRGWAWLKGPEEFTSDWDYVEARLIPASPAACFIYDVMKQIDPSRPRLAEELRDLMAATVAELPGPRRGRRRT
jgi:hypothetical protein